MVVGEESGSASALASGCRLETRRNVCTSWPRRILLLHSTGTLPDNKQFKYLMGEESLNETVPIRYLGTKKIESNGSLWD